MRIRSIKPEFWESENLGRVSREARLLFIGLFSCCDDSGRTRASSRLLASRLFPYDTDAAALIDGWLGELEGVRCVRRYVVDGEQYLDIPKWLSHQKIDRPSVSKLPEFSEGSRGFAKCSLGTGNGNREQGSAPEVEFALEAEPQGAQAPEEHKAERAPARKPDLNLEALAEVSGWVVAEVTGKGWGQARGALKDIKSANPDVTPDEIRLRAARYRKEWPGITITPSALAKHWARFGDTAASDPIQALRDLKNRMETHPCHPSQMAYAEQITPTHKSEWLKLKEELAQLEAAVESRGGAK